jgi:dihydroneopterin aldolase
MTFMACHGMQPEEKTHPQVFKVDLEMGLDLRPAGSSDKLADTIDYDRAFHLVEEVVTGTCCNLIESLAEKIAGALLEAFKQLQEVSVTVYKPGAPVLGEFEYFAVKINRQAN